MAHSCVTVPLDELFARSTSDARAAFDAFVALTRRIDAPWVERIDTFLGARWNAHHFTARSPADLAAIPDLSSIVCESYRDLGMQGALRSADPTDAAR